VTLSVNYSEMYQATLMPFYQNYQEMKTND